MACSSGSLSNWPLLPPAARVIDSYIKVPPKSFAPACKHKVAPSRPIFTQEVWMLRIRVCSTSRLTACISTASRRVGPERARPLCQMGDSICTNGRGTNSVKPPVLACKVRMRSK
ncbi:hypothetical protein D3C85_1056220 [compost metagenome]